MCVCVWCRCIQVRFVYFSKNFLRFVVFDSHISISCCVENVYGGVKMKGIDITAC